jgi:hypothetical protein
MMKLKNKSQKRLMNDLFIGKKSEIITNKFSGRSIELEPEAVALYDYIIGCNYTGQFGKDYNEAKDIFIENWPNAYMVLLD